MLAYGGHGVAISKAMDCGTEEDVKKALKNYIDEEDYNPTIFSEFNKNARIYNLSSVRYAPTDDRSLGHVGQTWVGTPYIEQTMVGSSPTYKLRYLRD